MTIKQDTHQNKEEKTSDLIPSFLTALILLTPVAALIYFGICMLANPPNVKITHDLDSLPVNTLVSLLRSNVVAVVDGEGPPQILSNVFEGDRATCGITREGDFIAYSYIRSVTEIKLPGMRNTLPAGSATTFIRTPDGTVHEFKKPIMLDDTVIDTENPTLTVSPPFEAYKSTNYTRLLCY